MKLQVKRQSKAAGKQKKIVKTEKSVYNGFTYRNDTNGVNSYGRNQQFYP